MVADHFVFSPDGSKLAFGFSTTTEPIRSGSTTSTPANAEAALTGGRVDRRRRARAPPLRELRRRGDPGLPLPAGGRRAVPGRRHRARRPRGAVAAVVLAALRRVHAVPRRARLRRRGAERPRLERLREALQTSTTSRCGSTRSRISPRCTRGSRRGRRSTARARSSTAARTAATWCSPRSRSSRSCGRRGSSSSGISNLVTFLENTSEYRRAAREREYGSLHRSRDPLRTSRLRAGSTTSARRSSSSTAATTRACR